MHPGGFGASSVAAISLPGSRCLGRRQDRRDSLCTWGGVMSRKSLAMERRASRPRYHSRGSRSCRQRHPETVKQPCHSERSEESRSALGRIGIQRTRARFLASLGMTGHFQSERPPQFLFFPSIIEKLHTTLPLRLCPRIAAQTLRPRRFQLGWAWCSAPNAAQAAPCNRNLAPLTFPE